MISDQMLDADAAMDASILNLKYPGIHDGFVDRRNVEVPGTFVPSAKAFAVSDHGYLLYMAHPMGIFGIKPRWGWCGSVRQKLFEVYRPYRLWFSVRGYAFALPAYKTLWAIEREFPKFGAIETHDVLAVEATPILFTSPKIAKAAAQLCHPNPGHEAECLRWIPITT